MEDVKKEEVPVLEHKVATIELEKFQLPNGYFLKILKDINGIQIDIRRHYKGYPTKHGITIPFELTKSIFGEVLRKYGK